jgi:glycosyltransferase involved in cell wall biosynthesis
MKTVVSIIMPTYNYGIFIEESLRKLQAQTYPHWECIIIDDGSMDNTREVVEGFIATDERFIYIHQENQGVSAARNLGLKKIRGDYVQFLDADDYLADDKLEKNIGLIKEEKLDFIYNNECWFTLDKNRQTIPQKTEFKEVNIQEDYNERMVQFISSNPFAINNPLFSKVLLEKTGAFHPDIHLGEDWLLWFQIAYTNPRIGKCKDVLVYIQRHNINKKQRKYLQSQIRVRNVMATYPLSEDLQYVNQKRKYWFLTNHSNKKYLIHLTLFYTIKYFLFAFPRTWSDFKIFVGDILFFRIRKLIKKS